MIQITFRDFYQRAFADEGFELYLLKDAHRHILYIGISHGGIWNRWFGGAASHMQLGADGELRGNSPVGQTIARGLPEAWSWYVELWTWEDCVQNLLREGITAVGGRDVRNLSIVDIEAYWIAALAPPYNTLQQNDREPTTSPPPFATPTLQGEETTMAKAVDWYLQSLVASQSCNTQKTYGQAMHALLHSVRVQGFDPDAMPVRELSSDMLLRFAEGLSEYAPSTQRLYAHAISRFCEFIAAEGPSDLKLVQAKRLLLHQSATKAIQQHPKLPADDISKLLDAVNDPLFTQAADTAERLREMRDRAFLLTLADTGLRVHEACKLRRGDVDMNEGQALVIGKGDKQAIVRFSGRALKALRDYLSARGELDGTSGKPLAALPLFARHDKGAGKKVKAMTTETGRNIVHERVAQVLGETATGRITPHSLRHYFVTMVLRAKGNLKMAQEMARHTSIQVTQRYAHLSNDELDKAYDEIFNKHG